MKLYFLAVPFLLTAASATAQQTVADCESAIAYNKTEIETNYASKLAVWETIDKSNFEQRKTDQKLGANIYGIPVDYSYEQFDEARSRLRQSLSIQQDIVVSTNSRWQAVDPGSTDRYIACVEQVTKKKFTATIIYANRESVHILVKKIENPGQYNIDRVNVIDTTGAKPTRTSVKLAGNSSTTLVYKRKPLAAFDTAIVLTTAQGADIETASFSIPRYTNIRNEPVQITLKSQEQRCEHSSTGPAAGPMNISANINQTLLVGTQSMEYRALDPAHCSLGGVSSNFTNLTSTRIDMTATCASNNNNCTYPVSVWFTVKALEDNYVDVDAKSKMAALSASRKKPRK